MSTTESPAQLEWWANSRTRLGVIPLRIRATGNGTWQAAATGETDDERRADLLFLIDMDPHFTLRFPDESAVEVTVAHDGDLAHLRLTRAEAADRQPEPERPAVRTTLPLVE
ncbi:hypothetical protein [Yinghuangia soli]|uniref:Uncharacterized protein n=1 Tax=Yinghuangia soli TaxID=2908204 RepID=A0AA41TZI8_9ACTN|nr:hypothetical protein [Yinghuangia soli]MCF2527551.1 hypothetical protein [Yinghuangia soli]